MPNMVLILCCFFSRLPLSHFDFFFLRVWQGVADVLKLLIGGGAGHKQALLVACRVRSTRERE